MQVKTLLSVEELIEHVSIHPLVLLLLLILNVILAVVLIGHLLEGEWQALEDRADSLESGEGLLRARAQ